ncbi:hypothetical protein [Archangium lansingense]|uniref:Uncharacterized protein n=1 Tax=Archangium lansingense TaxID=2995310 RepID=A0ABT4A663_9BACT|nr:hypothetical protein [Archangium lansinium]MCY1077112.1 hypothetical protein [Archangium lansinium]
MMRVPHSDVLLVYIGGFEACSRKHGPVFVFWFDDPSGTYMFSLFRNGERVRFRSRGAEAWFAQPRSTPALDRQ